MSYRQNSAGGRRSINQDFNLKINIRKDRF